jgi:predicted dehydrogenase
MGKLRTAVIGVGHLGKEHARVYTELEGVELVAVADTDRERAGEVAARLGCKALTDYQGLASEVDAVSVVVPTSGHYEVASYFLGKGVATLVEKPMTRTVEEATALVELSHKRSVPLQVGHIERFNPVVLAARKFDITPKFVETDRLSPFSFRSSDVGVVLDMMIHDIDLALTILGAEPSRVDAVGFGVITTKEDIANARLAFPNGAVANLTASRLALKTMRKIRVFSTDSYISMDSATKTGIVIKATDKLTVDALKVDDMKIDDISGLKDFVFGDLLKIEPLEVDDYEPLKNELESFTNCVAQGTPSVVPGEHGLRTMRTADRILTSIRTHDWYGANPREEA